MATFKFMPWCKIDKAYTAGRVTIEPFNGRNLTAGLDAQTVTHIKTILSSFKELSGKPVEKAALIRYDNKDLLADLSDEENETVAEAIDLICFGGLANREYFKAAGRYCNADCFIVYEQKLHRSPPPYTTVISRRREGQTQNVRIPMETVFSIPVHVSSVREIHLDEKLLSALIDFRSNVPSDKWARWRNAIACFNHANTDNESVPRQVEWVLLCSAIEHLLGAKSNAKDVAQKFTSTLIPNNSRLAKCARRNLKKWPRDREKPLRYVWMKEFYSIRGDYAHGKLRTQQRMCWKPLEHIVLATIAFPLLVRYLLEKEGMYTLTNEDKIQIDAFERFADEDFLKPPSRNSFDWWWQRVRFEVILDRASQNFVAAIEALTSEGDDDSC